MDSTLATHTAHSRQIEPTKWASRRSAQPAHRLGSNSPDDPTARSGGYIAAAASPCARLLSPLPTVAAMPSIPAGKPVTVPSTARSESQAAYLPIRPSRWRSRVASSFSPPRGPLSRERPVRRGRPAPYLSRDGTLVHLAPFATPHMGLFGATAWGYLGWPPYDSAALTGGERTTAGSSPRGTSIQDVPTARSTATTGAGVTLPRSPRDPSKSAQGAR